MAIKKWLVEVMTTCTIEVDAETKEQAEQKARDTEVSDPGGWQTEYDWDDELTVTEIEPETEP